MIGKTCIASCHINPERYQFIFWIQNVGFTLIKKNSSCSLLAAETLRTGKTIRHPDAFEEEEESDETKLPKDEKDGVFCNMQHVRTSERRGGWELHGWQSATWYQRTGLTISF